MTVANVKYWPFLFGKPTQDDETPEEPIVCLPCHTELLGILLGSYGIAYSKASHLMFAYRNRAEMMWRDGASVPDIAAGICQSERFAGRA